MGVCASDTAKVAQPVEVKRSNTAQSHSERQQEIPQTANQRSPFQGALKNTVDAKSTTIDAGKKDDGRVFVKMPENSNDANRRELYLEDDPSLAFLVEIFQTSTIFKEGDPGLQASTDPLSFLSSRLSQFTKATRIFTTRDYTH